MTLSHIPRTVNVPTIQYVLQNITNVEHNVYVIGEQTVVSTNHPEVSRCVVWDGPGPQPS